MLVVEFKAMTSIASTPMLVVDVDLYSICVRDIAIDDDEIPVRFIRCQDTGPL